MPLGIVLCLWLAIDKQVFTEEIFDVPEKFVRSLNVDEPIRYGRKVSQNRRAMYAWIRDETPTDSVFITPYLPEFWIYAEREQVAGFRHPPHDRRLIEWQQRLEALNGFQPFIRRGFNIKKELSDNEGSLTVAQILRIRDRYGATHYLAKQRRPELDAYLLYAIGRYYLYRIVELEPDRARSRAPGLRDDNGVSRSARYTGSRRPNNGG